MRVGKRRGRKGTREGKKRECREEEREGRERGQREGRENGERVERGGGERDRRKRKKCRGMNPRHFLKSDDRTSSYRITEVQKKD